MESPTQYENAVLIDGSEDVTQLEVRGHTTQSEALQTWTDGSGNVLARLTAEGYLQLGEPGSGAPAALLEAIRQLNLSVDDPEHGLQTRGEVTGQVLDALTWVLHELELLGTGGVHSLQAALRSRLAHRNSGDSSQAELRAGDFEVVNAEGPVAQATGLHAAASNESSALLDKAVGVEATIHNELNGDIDEAAAFSVAPPTNDGVIDTLIGLQVPDLDQGTANYAIHTGVGLVHLGDVVELIEQATTPANPASGIMRLYPKSDQKLYALDSSGNEYDLTGGLTSLPVHTHQDAANGGKLTAAAINSTGASNGDVLTADGLGGAAWVAVSGATSIGARVYNNASISLPHNTQIAVTFNSERYDTDNIHSLSKGLTNRLTCQTAGTYVIAGNMYISGGAANYGQINIRLNGSINLAVQRSYSSAFHLNIAAIYRLSVGDYVEMLAWQSSGSTQSIFSVGNYSPEFAMHRIGD